MYGKEAMKTKEISGVHIRKPDASDGKMIWDLVKNSNQLDVNSPYCYIMLGAYFSNTSAVAELAGKLVGAITGFRLPERPDTLFVWQVVVEPEARGQGIARKLIEFVLGREENQDIRYVEATVSPSNLPSKSLFLGFARDREAPCKESIGFSVSLFPEAHEDEPLLTIGPIK